MTTVHPRPPVGPATRATLRIGTRGSALARRQTEVVAERLARLGLGVEVVPIVTTGDRRPPDTAWGEAAFVGALREALLAGEIDLAVHSAKDVPLDGPPGLTIAAYLDRQDPRDVLVVARRGDGARPSADPLALLPRGARVGTDSPRRTGFLRAARPDLQVVPLHGNVDTRLRRLDAGEVDALVLAAAGLLRLGRGDRIDASLPLDLCPPAPGQGALAVEARAADAGSHLEPLAALDEPAVRLAVEAERFVLARLGGGCRAPIGVAAWLVDGGGETRTEEAEGPRGARRGELVIVAGVVGPDGRDRRIVERRGPAEAWATLASEVAEALASRPGRASVRGSRALATEVEG